MANTPPPRPGAPNQSTLELIYAIKGLAQALEQMHSDLVHRLEAEGRDRDRDIERISADIQDIQRVIGALPVATADRIEATINRKVDGVLDDTRRVLDDVRMKLWMHLGAPRGADASGSGMTIKDGMPAPAENVTGRLTLMDDGHMKVEGKVNALKVAKAVAIAKWIFISIASVGGLAGIIKIIVDYYRH
jgi:hypothetical protein